MLKGCSSFQGRFLTVVVLIILACAVFSWVVDAQVAPTTYPLYTGTDPKPVPPAPALGPANSVITDPTFGTRILRVTDQNTDSGNSLISTETGFKRTFNADSTAIKLSGVGGKGFWLEFNAAAFKVGDGTSRPSPHPLWFGSNWEWSAVDPDIIYFLNGNKIAKYNKSTGVTTNLGGPPNGDAVTYATAVIGQDNWVCSAAGAGYQDSYTKFFCINPSNTSQYQFVDVYNKTINGAPATNLTKWPTSAAGQVIGIHAIAPGTGSEWVYLSFHQQSWGGNGDAIFNLQSQTWSLVTNADPYWSGHATLGNGKFTNGSGTKSGTDPRSYLVRDPDDLMNASKYLFIEQPTDTAEWCTGEHPSWHNSGNNPDAPLLISRFAPTSCTGAWTGEIILAAVDGSNTVWRVAHNHATDGLNCFYGQGFAQISSDGKWALFSSTWDRTLGPDTAWGCTTRIDTFLVDLTGVTASVGNGSGSGTSGSGTSGSTSGSTSGGSTSTGTSTTTRVEETDSAVTYSGTWFLVTNGGMYSGGTMRSSMDANARATLSFTGTSVTFITMSDEWSGIAEIYVDGNPTTQVDLYASPAIRQAKAYTVSGLTVGSHTVGIGPIGRKNASAQGYWVQLDAFDVITTSNVTTTPSPAPTTISGVSGSGASGSTASLTATLSSGGSGLGGKTISFTVNGTAAGTGMTHNSGVATLSGVSLSGTNAGNYSTAVAANFAGDTSYAASSGSGALSVSAPPPASTAISAVSGSGTSGSTATLTATLASGGSGLSGKTISFTLNGTAAGTGMTNSSGVATLSGVSLSGTNAGNYSTAVAANFAGDTSYAASSGSGALTVIASTSGSGTSTSGTGSSGSTTVSTSGGSTSTGTSTTMRVEETSAAITYSGTWSLVTNGGMYSGRTMKASMDANARATLSFTGTSVTFITMSDEWSGIAQIYVDGNPATQVDLYASPAIRQAKAYTVSGLTLGPHTVGIGPTGRKNASAQGYWTQLDAFDVMTTSNAIPTVSSDTSTASTGSSAPTSTPATTHSMSGNRAFGSTLTGTTPTQSLIGGQSLTTSGGGRSMQVGSAQITAAAGQQSVPSGVAIFGYRESGVLVAEAGVPAGAPTRRGRIYAEVSGPANTGLAVANANDSAATVSFFFTDTNGTDFGNGTVTIPAHGQIARFLNETPFNGPQRTEGTFTFSSNIPVAAIAIRGFLNERSEFLATTLPVADPDALPSGSVYFPQFADGGGWTTQFVLVNPSDQAISGTLSFYGQGTAGAPAPNLSMNIDGAVVSQVAYSIPAHSSKRFSTRNTSSEMKVGSARATPAGFSTAPVGAAIFSYHNGGITVSEAGTPSMTAGNAFRLYAEADTSNAIQTAVAVENAGSSDTLVNFELTRLDGTSTGHSGQLVIPASGQRAVFLNQIPGFESLPMPFKGVLRISSGNANIAVLGVRSRWNERGDFIFTTTPATNESAPGHSTLVFPQIVDGAGYTTQFITFSGTPAEPPSGNLQLFTQSGGSLDISLR